MTYQTPTEGMPSTCSQCGAVTTDTAQHDAWHRYLIARRAAAGEEDQLRQELDTATAQAAAHREYTDAAVRAADAADRAARPGAQQPEVDELYAALKQWRRVRDQQETRVLTCRCPQDGGPGPGSEPVYWYCAVHDRASRPQGPPVTGQTEYHQT